MQRPGLLPGQAELVQQPKHAVLVPVGHGETRLYQLAQILGGPAADAIALRVGPAQNPGPERRQLALAEKGGSPVARPIGQALDTGRVEADHPVA